MVGQASRLSIRMTGRMPVPPAIPEARRLLRSARNDASSMDTLSRRTERLRQQVQKGLDTFSTTG